MRNSTDSIRNMLLLPLAPVLVALALSLARRSALLTSAAGALAAVVICAVAYPLTPGQIAEATRQWAPVMIEVLAIVFGGLLLSEAMRRTGRQDVIASWLGRTLGTGTPAALAVLHGVTPFAESVTGFGIGVTLAIPLLLHLGFSSRRAATIGLLGLCTVPWGSMAPGTLIAASLSGIGFQPLGVGSAIASGPVFIGVGLVVATLTSPPGARARNLAAATASGATLWASILVANLLLGTPVAGAVGALLTLVAHLLVHRLRGARIVVTRALAAAASPYAVLLGGILIATALLDATRAGGPWHYLASPAIWLPLSVATTLRGRDLAGAVAATARRWLPVGPANGLFLLLGVVMAVSGMAAAIARAVAQLGPAYVLPLGFLAALGGWLTGSNAAANAMFAAPQSEIIRLLGLPALIAMSVHNVCSSLFMMASPAKIELAAQLCPEPAEGRRAGRTVTITALVITGVLSLGLGLLTLSPTMPR